MIDHGDEDLNVLQLALNSLSEKRKRDNARGDIRVLRSDLVQVLNALESGHNPDPDNGALARLCEAAKRPYIQRLARREKR